MRSILPALIGAIVVAASASAAHATFYTTLSDYSAAIAIDSTSPSTPVTFEDVTVPADPVNTFNNITPIAANRYSGLLLPNASVVGTMYAFGVASQAVVGNTSIGDVMIGLTDSHALDVGLNLAVFGGGLATVSILSGNTIVASIIINANDETMLNSFVGYTGTTPITAIDITPADPSSFVLADNVQYSVPEPASMVIMLGGVAVLAAARRRRV